MRTTRLLWIAGLAHLALAAVLAFALAAPVGTHDRFAHALLLTTGASFLAGALVMGVWPAFLQREWDLRWLTHAAVAMATIGDVLWMGQLVAGMDAARTLAATHGVALLLLALHAPAARLLGKAWEKGEPLLARGQPFRLGDALALAAFALAFVSLAAGSLLLLAPPRPVPTAALATLSLGFLAPAALGCQLFLLPREARTPMPGVTLVAFALGLHALATLAIALGLARPVGFDFRYPAFSVALAYVLVAVALARLRFPEDGASRVSSAKPMLRAGVALLLLAGVSVPLAFLAGAPNELLPLAFYANLALALVGLAAAATVGAHLMLPWQPRGGAWGKWASALAILGLFLLAPSFQYPRSPFPGTLVLLLALALAGFAVAPAARAPAASRRRRRMHRR